MSGEPVAWSIFDETGNLVDAYSDEATARAAFAQVDPRLNWSLITQAADGMLTGYETDRPDV